MRYLNDEMKTEPETNQNILLRVADKQRLVRQIRRDCILKILILTILVSLAWMILPASGRTVLAASNTLVEVEIPVKYIAGEGSEEAEEHISLTPDLPSNPMPKGTKNGRRQITVKSSAETTFGAIAYTSPGKYDYTVEAESDPAVFHVQTVATSDGQGSLIITKEGEQGKTGIVFRAAGAGNEEPAEDPEMPPATAQEPGNGQQESGNDQQESVDSQGEGSEKEPGGGNRADPAEGSDAASGSATGTTPTGDRMPVVLWITLGILSQLCLAWLLAEEIGWLPEIKKRLRSRGTGLCVVLLCGWLLGIGLMGAGMEPAFGQDVTPGGGALSGQASEGEEISELLGDDRRISGKGKEAGVKHENERDAISGGSSIRGDISGEKSVVGEKHLDGEKPLDGEKLLDGETSLDGEKFLGGETSLEEKKSLEEELIDEEKYPDEEMALDEARLLNEEKEPALRGASAGDSEDAGEATEGNTKSGARSAVRRHDLIMWTNVTGDLGDLTKRFRFEISFTGLESEHVYDTLADETILDPTSAAGQLLQAKGISLNAADIQTVTADAAGKATATISLGDDQGVILPGLPEGATYRITEASSDHIATFRQESIGQAGVEAAGQPFFIKSSGTNGSTSNASLRTAKETIDAGDGTVLIAWENARNLAPGTGVSVNRWAWLGALMSLIACAAACFVAAGRSAASEQDSWL